MVFDRTNVMLASHFKYIYHTQALRRYHVSCNKKAAR